MAHTDGKGKNKNLEVESMTSMRELEMYSERPHIGKTGIFYDVNREEHFFVSLVGFTTAQFNHVWQTCMKFEVHCIGQYGELVVTMNHPDMTWNELHPDVLPALIENSLVMNDKEAFLKFTHLLLEWEENVAACGGKIRGYHDRKI